MNYGKVKTLVGGRKVGTVMRRGGFEGENGSVEDGLGVFARGREQDQEVG